MRHKKIVNMYQRKKSVHTIRIKQQSLYNSLVNRQHQYQNTTKGYQCLNPTPSCLYDYQGVAQRTMVSLYLYRLYNRCQFKVWRTFDSKGCINSLSHVVRDIKCILKRETIISVLYKIIAWTLWVVHSWCVEMQHVCQHSIVLQWTSKFFFRPT